MLGIGRSSTNPQVICNNARVYKESTLSQQRWHRLPQLQPTKSPMVEHILSSPCSSRKPRKLLSMLFLLVESLPSSSKNPRLSKRGWPPGPVMRRFPSIVGSKSLNCCKKRYRWPQAKENQRSNASISYFHVVMKVSIAADRDPTMSSFPMSTRLRLSM